MLYQCLFPILDANEDETANDLFIFWLLMMLENVQKFFHLHISVTDDAEKCSAYVCFIFQLLLMKNVQQMFGLYF